MLNLKRLYFAVKSAFLADALCIVRDFRTIAVTVIIGTVIFPFHGAVALDSERPLTAAAWT